MAIAFILVARGGKNSRADGTEPDTHMKAEYRISRRAAGRIAMLLLPVTAATLIHAEELSIPPDATAAIPLETTPAPEDRKAVSDQSTGKPAMDSIPWPVACMAASGLLFIRRRPH